MTKRTASHLFAATTVLCLLAVSAGFGQAAEKKGLLTNPRPSTLLSGGGGCAINHLELTFHTGNDDLRGGENNLNLEIHLDNGSIQFAKNVNRGANWPNNSSRQVSIPLDHPIAPNQIKSIWLIHLAQGGFHPTPVGAPGEPVDPGLSVAAGIKSEDNWDMAEMQAFGIGQSTNVPIASFGFHRFTGTNPSLEVRARPDVSCPSPNQVRLLQFLFKTGNDDMRGGNDNLNITIFADGRTQTAANVNGSQRWADGSTHEVTIALNRPVTIEQIHQIALETTFKGGAGGDNWNMDSVQIVAIMSGVNRPLATQGFYRFTGPPGNKLIIRTK